MNKLQPDNYYPSQVLDSHMIHIWILQSFDKAMKQNLYTYELIKFTIQPFTYVEDVTMITRFCYLINSTGYFGGGQAKNRLGVSERTKLPIRISLVKYCIP